ncbi:MAG: SLC13 family permease [Parashewanella sp.]
MSKNIIVVLNILLYVILLNTLPFEPMLVKGLSLFIFIAILWLTEAVPLSVTALLVPLCATLTGILPLKQALSSFATPIIFLFLAGFTLAAALKKQGLDVVMADKVVHLARGKLLNAVLLLFALTAFMSMWMSNTATVAVMTPLALGLIKQSAEKPSAKVYLFTLLGLAYSASIGGIGTLVGSPPNAIVALEMNLDFTSWLQYGIPTMLIMLPIILTVLWFSIRPDLNHTFKFQQQEFKFTRERVLTIAVFFITILLWSFSKPISKAFGGIASFDVVVALFAIAMIGITRLVEWKDIEKEVEWGVLLLFGGGLALSAILKITGVSDFIAVAISNSLYDASSWIVIGSIALFVVFLTELSSNTASAAILVPIFVPVAEALGVPAIFMAATIGVAASCAFMLPVATPPNAIVYATGHVPIPQMVRKGFILNILCVIILLLMVHFIWQ